MNVGFIQYQLPIDIVTNKKTKLFLNNDDYLKQDSKLSYFADLDDTTNCILKNQEDLPISDAEIIIQFDKTYHCDGIQLVFNTDIQTVQVYDYSDKDNLVLLVDQKQKTKTVQQILSRDLSAILVTKIQPCVQEEDVLIKEISTYNNEIEAPQGYFFKNIEIQSQTGEEEKKTNE